jgi:diphosphomevalonate decarboxylase
VQTADDGQAMRGNVTQLTCSLGQTVLIWEADAESLCSMKKATAVAHPNIAFIKYWGRADEGLNLPANPSLSMNLAALATVTTVEFREDLASDDVVIGDRQATGEARERVVAHLDRVRTLAGIENRARVVSRSDFPAGTGLASSASAFAALSLAAADAAGLDLEEAALSRLARLGSGSACRSVPAGFTLWQGEEDATSYARQVAAAEHWLLCDVMAIVDRRPKAVGSRAGHGLAPSSPFYRARLGAVPSWLAVVESGIQHRDLQAMGPVVEADTLAMHGVMMTSRPPLLYWQPATVEVWRAVHAWRTAGGEAYCSMDAGPNVHCLCESDDAGKLAARLQSLPGVQEILVSGPGRGTRQVACHLF